MRSRAAALAILLLLVPALPAPLPLAPLGPAAAQGATLSGVTYDWWGASACADPASPACWHMRVPILLEPRAIDRLSGGVIDLAGDRIRNYPAQVEVDFTQAIRDAGPAAFGWPRDAQGRLASFTFDPDSVRVVEYERFRGCIFTRDRTTGGQRCAQTGDNRDDMVVASSFGPGLWLNPRGVDPNYDPQRNAVGTVQWVVRGEFSAPRLFFAYFDILENGDKAPARYRPEDTGTLEGLHFVRSGTDILGFAPGTTQSGPGVLLAQALFDNTTITMSKYVGRGVEPLVMVGPVALNSLGTAANTQAGTCPGPSYGFNTFPGTACLDIPQGERFFFRVQANKPVIVAARAIGSSDNPFGGGSGWIPSRDGGLAGNEFLFRAMSDEGQGATPTPLWVYSPTGGTQVSFSCGASSGNLFVDGVAAIDTVAMGVCVVRSAPRPVLLQAGAPDGLFSMPLVGIHGAPVGRNLVGVVHNDVTLVAPDREGTLALASPVTNPDHAQHLEGVPLDVGAGEALYFNGGKYGAIGEPWRFDRRDEGLLWGKAGEYGIGPVGGRGGMDFAVSLQRTHTAGTTIDNSRVDPSEGRLILLPYYNNTRVVVSNATSGRAVLNQSISLHDWIDRNTTGGSAISYGHWNISASKPLAAYWFGPGEATDPPYGIYYSARVESPLATIGPGEFHGYAVGWEEKVKSSAVGPGERVRIKLRAINLGRGIGAAPISDDFTISKEVGVAANVTAPGVDLSSVLESGVPSFQGRDITLSVSVPADAATGTVYQVNVTATSRGNPRFQDVARVIVTVQIRYEFTLRFVETNSTAIQKIIKPDTATCMDIEVKNTGTGDVTLRLQMTPTKRSPSALGFDPQLLPRVSGACELGTLQPLVNEDGQPAVPLQLARGQGTTITLYVKAPADTRPLPLELEVQGTAQEDASVRQQVSAVVFTNVEAKVKLTALNDTRTILPGANATYRMLLENIGDVETPIEFGTTGLLPLGWAIRFDGAPELLRGRGSVDALGNPLDRAEFTVNVTAARDAPVALIVPVNIVATSAIIIDTGDTARAFRQSDTAKVTAVVGNNFTLEQPEALPVTINPGETFSLQLDLRNIANGPFRLRVAPGSLPRNWTLVVEEPRNETRLAVGDRLNLRINITPEVATRAGVYDVGIVLATQDNFTQGARFRNVSVLVRSTVEFRIEPEVPALVLPPGGQREVDLRVLNTGNLPVALRLGALAPSGYQASYPNGSRAELQPGEETRRLLLIRAPDTSAEAEQAVRITGLDETSNKQKEFRVAVQTARIDLLVTDVQLADRDPAVGSPAVVVASVQNRGTIPANNVGIALLVNGRSVRNDTVRTLPPGEPRTITLPWTVDEPLREVLVVVDGDDQYAETDESNNQRGIELSKGLPGFQGPEALGALALALLAGVAARARHKPPRRGGGRDG